MSDREILVKADWLRGIIDQRDELLAALNCMVENFPPPPIRSRRGACRFDGMAGNLAHAQASKAIEKAEPRAEGGGNE